MQDKGRDRVCVSYVHVCMEEVVMCQMTSGGVVGRGVRECGKASTPMRCDEQMFVAKFLVSRPEITGYKQR